MNEIYWPRSSNARSVEHLYVWMITQIQNDRLENDYNFGYIWWKVVCLIWHMVLFQDDVWLLHWASYQIRKIAGCACAGNAGNVFLRRRFQWKPLLSDPGMHHGTCVTHVPWCMSGSLTCGDGENVPGIPGACASAILRIWQEAHVNESTLKNKDKFITWIHYWLLVRSKQTKNQNEIVYKFYRYSRVPL